MKLARHSVERAQTSLREVTDVLGREAALQNSLKNDSAVTEAIRQYEALGPADRARFVVTNDHFRDIFARPWQEATDNIPATPELRSQFPFIQRSAEPASFDLALRKSDVFAQQVKLTNALFKDADPKVLSAVEAWEKLTSDQKRTFTRRRRTPRTTGTISISPTSCSYCAITG